MTIEEKAKEIAVKWKAKGLPYNAIYDSCLEMARWKDEQFDKFISSMGLVVKEMYEQYKERRQPPTDNKSTLYLSQNPEIQKELNELVNKLSVSFIGKEITFNTPTCQVTFKFN